MKVVSELLGHADIRTTSQVYSHVIVKGQAPDGTPVGTQFEVNGAFSTGSQGFPSVDTDPDGDFVVVWRDAAAYMNEGIGARRYAADGTPQGGAFAVFPAAFGDRGSADVATDAAGNFVVVWNQYILHEGSSIHGRAVVSVTSSFRSRSRISRAARAVAMFRLTFAYYTPPAFGGTSHEI